MIKYEWVTPETRDAFIAVLNKHKLAFQEWHAAKPEGRYTQDAAYKAWWMQRGPLGFGSTEDSLRFKQELWEHILVPTPDAEHREEAVD